MINKNNRLKKFIQKNNDIDVNIFDFAKVNIPSMDVVLPTDKDTMVRYGSDNLFAFFLLDLYKKCPIHQAIINNKSNYIGSLRTKKGEIINQQINPNESFNDFVEKIKLSFLIFNFFAVEVVFNNLNEPIQYIFIEPQNIRTNQHKNKFFYNSNGWKRSGGETIEYERYYPKLNQTSTSKIFYFDGYTPSGNVYPDTEYCSSFTSILTDISIRDFNINNIKNHFSASTLLTFFGDHITQQQKNETKEGFKNNFAGENGNKLFINFQKDSNFMPNVQQLASGDWDKAYDLISQKVEKDIFIGAQFNAILLTGKNGGLGNPQELKTAYEIFKANYIDQKRNVLLGAFNLLFSESKDIIKDIDFYEEPLFNDELSETTKIQILTVNELRKLAGFPPIQNGDRLVNEPINETKNDDNIEPSQEDFDSIFQYFSDENIGVSIDDYEEINDNGFSFSEDEKDEIITMYKYVKREEASGGTLIPTSRNFCRRLIDMNRYFSREDITKMSEKLGYDVYVHCGGWWRKNKQSVNHCRHQWQQIKLKKKNN